MLFKLCYEDVAALYFNAITTNEAHVKICETGTSWTGIRVSISHVHTSSQSGRKSVYILWSKRSINVSFVCNEISVVLIFL